MRKNLYQVVVLKDNKSVVVADFCNCKQADKFLNQVKNNRKHRLFLKDLKVVKCNFDSYQKERTEAAWNSFNRLFIKAIFKNTNTNHLI
ncbi:MAG: hypothetical protein LBC92_05855 [Rickettsiales bacterium]|jgi:hypothetical protein|nr:hypothetical protein [Rickettsiales bacterium]